MPFPIRFVPKNPSMDSVLSAEKVISPFVTGIKPVTETIVFALMKCAKMTLCVTENSQLLLYVLNVESMGTVTAPRSVMTTESVNVEMSFVMTILSVRRKTLTEPVLNVETIPTITVSSSRSVWKIISVDVRTTNALSF